LISFNVAAIGMSTSDEADIEIQQVFLVKFVIDRAV